MLASSRTRGRPARRVQLLFFLQLCRLMSVTVRFPLLLISIPVRFALHLSLWSMSNLRSCLHVFVLLLSACSGSWLSVQVVLVAAVLLLRSLLPARAAALRGCSFGGSCAAPAALAAPVGAILATSAGASFGCHCGALFCCSFGRSCRLRQLGHFLACF